MKRVLAVVASLHLAPSHASSGGWGSAGSTTGSGGAWPNHPANVPPKEPLQGAPVGQQADSVQPPLESSNHYNGGADSVNSAAAANAPPPAPPEHHDPPAYHSHPHRDQHQQYPPPHDPSYIPQETRWAGQHQNAPVRQHQHQQGSGQFPQHEGYPRSNYPPPPGDGVNGWGGGGKPLHLGTKWRTLVSRVKDAVRPGQPPPEDYWQGAGGYDAGYSDGGGGGTYSPSGSSWAVGVNENTGYDPLPPGVNGGYQNQDASSDFGGGGHDQQQLGSPVPTAAGYDPLRGAAGHSNGGAAVPASAGAAPFDYQLNQHRSAAPPPTYFDAKGLPSVQQPPGLPHDDGGGGGGQGEGGSWQSPPPTWPEGAQQQQRQRQQPGSFGGYDPEKRSDSHGHEVRSAGGYGGDGGGGGGGDGDSHVDMYGATIVPEGEHGSPAGERLSPLEPPPEPLPAGAPVLGQGWSSTSSAAAGPAPAGITQPVPLPGGESAQGTAATTNAESGTLPHVHDGHLPPPPTGSASAPTGSPGGGVPGSISMTPVPRPSAIAAVAKHSEEGEGQRVEPTAATDAFGSSSAGSSRLDESSGVMDTMPSSADHGMEKVDWGKGAEEAEEEDGEKGRGGREGAEGESGETEAVPGTEERLELDREEKALIRELERMDSSIGHGDDPSDVGREGSGVSGSTTPLPSPPPVEDQARIDEAVEHQLDDLFDSIILDGGVDVGEDCEPSGVSDVGIPLNTVGDVELISPVRNRPPVSEAADAVESTPPGIDRVSMDGSEARERSADQWEEAATTRRASVASPLGGYPAATAVGSSDDDSPPQGLAPVPASSTWSSAAVETAEKETASSWEGSSLSASSSASPVVAEAAILPEMEAVAGSGVGSGSWSGPLWGNTRRWESLPPQPAAVVSDSGDEGEEEERQEEEKDEGGSHDFEDEEDEADVRVPLDPIELPPSAATDEIWNDQHLQDQLDAYWEQSRRGGAQRQPSTGVRQQQEQEHQLSACGLGSQTHLQPTYGPGDWVGTGGASRAGGGAMSPEPLPGGVARAGGWVAAPNLLQGGNQAPINIYGNVHVHLQQGGGVQDGGAQQQQKQQHQGQHSSLSAELSARERYYSQGETSWSGSDRGGQ